MSVVRAVKCTCPREESTTCPAIKHTCTCYNDVTNCRHDGGHHSSQCIGDKTKCRGETDDCECTCISKFTDELDTDSCCIERHHEENLSVLRYAEYHDCKCICGLTRTTDEDKECGALYCNASHHNCICNDDFYTYCRFESRDSGQQNPLYTHEHCRCLKEGFCRSSNCVCTCNINVKSCRMSMGHHICTCIEYGSNNCRLDKKYGDHKSMCLQYGKRFPTIICYVKLDYNGEITHYGKRCGYRCGKEHYKCNTNVILSLFINALWDLEEGIVKIILEIIRLQSSNDEIKEITL